LKIISRGAAEFFSKTKKQIIHDNKTFASGHGHDFLTAAGLVHAAIPPAENLLPSDTLGFFTVPDCNALRAACKGFAAAHVLERPGDEPFHDKLVSKFTEKYIAPLEKDLGMKVDDFAALPAGTVHARRHPQRLERP